VLCPLIEIDPLINIPELGPARELLDRLEGNSADRITVQ